MNSSTAVPALGAIPKTARSLIIAALILFSLAAGIRALGIIEGPAEFQPVRQYFSALVARKLYYGGDEGLSESKRVYLERSAQPIHEPPITEGLSLIGFELLGEDNLWLPRSIAALSWLIGGLFLLLLLRRLLPMGAALVGTAVYLFLPYGVEQSLSFQPDSMMLAAGIAGIFCILRYHQQPSRGRFVVAIVACALALLVKPQIIFLIAGAWIGLALGRMSLLKLVRDRDSWLFALMVLLPLGLYLAFNILVMKSISAQQGMIPSALLSPHFYISWVYLLEDVLGYPLLILGLAGLVVMRGDLRNLTLGLWVGYVIFGMVFTYHFATHAYYHIAIIPPIAIGVAALAGAVVEALRGQNRAYATLTLLGVSVVALGLTAGQTVATFKHPGIDDKAALFADIGDAVAHSNDVVMYAQSEGLPLMYHGWISGWLWPTSWHRSLEARGFSGIVGGSGGHQSDEALRADIRVRLDELRDAGARWFVVTHLEDFRRQPGLEAYLRDNYQLLDEKQDYIIFDLGPSPQAS